MKKFKNIAIAGLGLIGGSLALSIKENKLAETVTGFGRSRERIKKAFDMGIIDNFFTEFEEGLENADMVIIGTPVRTITSIAEEIIPHLQPGTILSDVGSVKTPVVRSIESTVREDVFFIGGHPIAGTENSGFEASVSTLFNNRICVLTPTEKSNPEALMRLEDFWQSVGSRVIIMDSQRHDSIFAAISHLPHMVAFSLVDAIQQMERFEKNILEYSAGGFKDFTRIAASDPVMWLDIALMNKNKIVEAIDYFESSLAKLKSSILSGDEETIKQTFETARDKRRSI